MGGDAQSVDPMSQLTDIIKQQYLKPEARKNRPNTPEYQAVEKLENEIEAMQKECTLYNNPELFAKYGKMQRQILKMQKELKVLEETALAALNTPVLPATSELI